MGDVSLSAKSSAMYVPVQAMGFSWLSKVVARAVLISSWPGKGVFAVVRSGACWNLRISPGRASAWAEGTVLPQAAARRSAAVRVGVREARDFGFMRDLPKQKEPAGGRRRADRVFKLRAEGSPAPEMSPT